MTKEELRCENASISFGDQEEDSEDDPTTIWLMTHGGTRLTIIANKRAGKILRSTKTVSQRNEEVVDPGLHIVGHTSPNPSTKPRNSNQVSANAEEKVRATIKVPPFLKIC